MAALQLESGPPPTTRTTASSDAGRSSASPPRPAPVAGTSRLRWGAADRSGSASPPWRGALPPDTEAEGGSGEGGGGAGPAHVVGSPRAAALSPGHHRCDVWMT